MKKNGITGRGSSTGNAQHTAQVLELFTKSAREISRSVMQMRQVWLGEQLLKTGMPEELIEGVLNKDEGFTRLAKHWIEIHGISWGSSALNKVELYSHGDLVASEELFKMPNYADCKITEGC